MTHTLPLPDLTHERVEVITGRRSGLILTVALHSSALGPALGGARLWTYPHWSEATGDALRLSAAMTLKNAAAGLDAVGGSGEPAGPTSIDVYEAIRATLERVTGSGEVAGRALTISGLGQVGSRLAVRLSAEGARLTVTDVDPAKRFLAADLGAQWIDPGAEHAVPADVFVPAGVGGILTDEVIDALAARAVCGPANNPLVTRAGAERLAARGILYAPDFVVNAGGVIYLDQAAKNLGSRATIMDRVAAIGDTLRTVFDEAEARAITPLEAAEARVAERLRAGRKDSRHLVIG